MSGWITKIPTNKAQASAIDLRITVSTPTHNPPGTLLALATFQGRHSAGWNRQQVQFRLTAERGHVLHYTVRPDLTTR